MQDTVATITVSLRSSRDFVADSRICSMCSLMLESFSDAVDELVDRLGLIAGRGKRLGQTERAVGEGEDHGRRTAIGNMKALESSTMKPRATETPIPRPEALLPCPKGNRFRPRR